jgi:hypothetical protein
LATITLGIAAFTYAIDRGSSWGWLNVRTLGLAGAGIGLVEAGGASGMTLAIVVGMGGMAVVVGATILEILTAEGHTAADAVHAMLAVLGALAALAAVALAASGRLYRAGTAAAPSGK